MTNNKLIAFPAFFRRVAVVLALSIIALPVNAALVTYNFDFTVNVFDAADDFVTFYGLTDGDTVTGTATFDTSLLNGIAAESLSLTDPGDFTLVIGSLSLTEVDDLEFGTSPLPQVDFFDGEWLGFQFLTERTVNSKIYEISLEQDFFEITNLSGPTLVVQNSSPIPVPAALPLLLSGLAALFGMRWRSRRLAGG